MTKQTLEYISRVVQQRKYIDLRLWEFGIQVEKEVSAKQSQ
jgi:hypothetical protein